MEPYLNLIETLLAADDIRWHLSQISLWEMHPASAIKVIQILPELNAGNVERDTLEIGRYKPRAEVL